MAIDNQHITILIRTNKSIISVTHTHNNVDINVDEATTKPYQEGPYVSFTEGKRRAEVNNQHVNQPKCYDIRQLLATHDNINNIDATTKPYPEGPYVSFKEGKRRAEVKRLTIAKAEVEKKRVELNKQTTKTTQSGLNCSYESKASLATAA